MLLQDYAILMGIKEVMGFTHTHPPNTHTQQKRKEKASYGLYSDTRVEL